MVEGNVGEEGEGSACREEQVFEDDDADVPDERLCERGGENKWKEVEEVRWEEKDEVGGYDDCEGSACMGLYNECASSQCWTVLLPFNRDDRIEECRADAVENPWKDEEDSPEERKALAEEAGEEERDNERLGITEQSTERPAILSDKNTCLTPDMESNGHK